ncbi:guanidinobutyrase [Nannizzia gypsea CBS 118893]|uniref:Guanidinobutyrase n=1 Tax=Arthroderma gypseum (strain ATCC MYA-4604 / CBS 118893) TaxID=535722 RepID=E4UR04_ARTGP|nr:guanidinobutyrase [Nannizzia gypsea CBS 118893]EFR00119.1 guanidinobutyrase [Nannizzia gypsea CBS 118893]
MVYLRYGTLALVGTILGAQVADSHSHNDEGQIPLSQEELEHKWAPELMFEAFLELGMRKTAYQPKKGKQSKRQARISDGKPKLVTLGGDHSIILPALRALNQIYKKPITVIHFDAHQDTWESSRYDGYWKPDVDGLNHGTWLFHAGQEGLISNTTSAHAGLRSYLGGADDRDYRTGVEKGFMRIHADDVDDIGTQGVVDAIVSRVGLDPDQPVYISLDIDVLDPSIAPGTGTPESGGWTSRELARILRGLEKLNVVGADVVEVSPSYDHRAGGTALAAAHVVNEIIASMVKLGVEDPDKVGGWFGRKGEKSVKEGVMESYQGGADSSEAQKDEL